MAIRVVGVLDIKGGVAVRGVGGRRSEYQAVPGFRSIAEVAASWGVSEIYVADLDAIEGGPPALSVYRELASRYRLWVDAGVRTAIDRAHMTGPWRTVVGLETAQGVEAIRPGDCFSLDLRGGRPMGTWGEDPLAIARRAVDAGATAILVIDLMRVGTASGTGTERLCCALRAEFPGVELLAGGGIRHRENLARLEAAGVDAALVGTALSHLIA